MQTLREQFHSVKGAEISHENMSEVDLKSPWATSVDANLLALYFFKNP